MQQHALTDAGGCEGADHAEECLAHLCELVEDHDLRCHVLWATHSWFGLEQPLQGNHNDAHLKV